MKKPPSQPFDHSLAEPGQPDFVRELLEAARAEHAAQVNVGGYDVEAGLARHLAVVQSGAAMPEWAQGLAKSAAVAGTGAVGASSVAKVLPWIALPLLTAGVIAVMVSGSPSKAPSVSAPPVAPAPQAAPVQLAQPATVAAEKPTPEMVFEAPQNEASGSRELSTDEVLARVKRDVIARRNAAHPAQTTNAKAADPRSVDALMQGNASSRGSVRLAPHANSVQDTTTQTAATREESAQVEEESAEGISTRERAVKPAPVVDDSRLEREMGMLAMAQRVLQSDPERALRLARQGEQEFAGSMFTQERQQVLLLALIQLGRMPEAKRLAQPYLKRYPNGPFSDRLRRALVTGKLGSESGRDVNN